MYYLETARHDKKLYAAIWQDVDDKWIVLIDTPVIHPNLAVYENGTRMPKYQYMYNLSRCFKSESLEEIYIQASIESL